jgi:hypothetical protein
MWETLDSCGQVEQMAEEGIKFSEGSGNGHTFCWESPHLYELSLLLWFRQQTGWGHFCRFCVPASADLLGMYPLILACVQRYISIRSAKLIHQVLVQETSPFPLVLTSRAVVAFEVCLTFLPQHHLCIPSPTLWFKCMLHWFLDTKSLGFIFLKSSVIWMKFICQGHQNW